MGFQAITLTEIAVGRPVTNPLMEKIKNNFDFLFGLSGAAGAVGGIPNASFEIDADESGIPDQWTRDFYNGGTGGYETVDIIHGARAYFFTHPGGVGNGGGFLTSDYLEASGGMTITVGFFLKTSVAGISVVGRVLCYDKDKIQLAGANAFVNFYSSTANPTTWQLVDGFANLPLGTRFIKIQLHGGMNNVNVAGTVRFDYCFMKESDIEPITVVAGENLLISSDETITFSDIEAFAVAKSIRIRRIGTLRIRFDIKTCQARTYRNGVAIGISRDANLDWVTFTEDITGWNVGDLVQVFIRNNATQNGHLKNFRIFTNVLSRTETILMDAL